MIDGTGAGVVLIAPTGERLKYVLRIHFQASNNIAEYEALIDGLRVAISLGIRNLMVWGDSQLMVRQVSKDYSCSSESMDAYCQEVKKLEEKFTGLELHHIIRDNNEKADRLARMGSTRAKIPPTSLLRT